MKTLTQYITEASKPVKEFETALGLSFPSKAKVQEGILGDIDDTLYDGDKYVKRYETFGFKYKLRYIFTTSSVNHDWIDTYKLQKLTKDMYVNDRLKEICKESWMTPQLYHLAIYIDNISRTELKMDDKKNLCRLRSNDKRVESFSENLQKILIDKGILISNNIDIETYTTGSTKLMIHIEDTIKIDNKKRTKEWVEFEYKFEE